MVMNVVFTQKPLRLPHFYCKILHLQSQQNTRLFRIRNLYKPGYYPIQSLIQLPPSAV